MRYKTNENQRGQPDYTGHRLAQGLGVFSILLGLMEVALGGPLGRALGLDNMEWLIRAYGAREILNGVLILMAKDYMPWIWTRVAGDVLDLATLAYGYQRDPGDSTGILIAAIAVGGVTLLDVYCAMKLTKDSKEPLPPPADYSNRGGMPRSV